MYRTALFALVTLLSSRDTLASIDEAAEQVVLASLPYEEVCHWIKSSISTASAVSFPTDETYHADVAFYAATNQQQSACSVQPGSTEDVGTILGILGSSRTPFGIKGGGHGMYPGCSSTSGVQIAMTRFSEVKYDANTETVEVGAGLVWDDVYAALEPYNRSVVGGRVTGVGVSGFTLGGGLSYKTNQYGLAIDNVVAYELVLPNGTATSVTETENEALFFALKGGGNNFGIVTRFTLKTHYQGPAWGGLMSIDTTQFDAFNDALVKFGSETTDPKAALVPSYLSIFGQRSAIALLFYDGPEPPQGRFDNFLALNSTSSDLHTRSFLSLVQAAPIKQSANLRGHYHHVSITSISPSILKTIIDEHEIVPKGLDGNQNIIFSYSVQPFLPTMFSHGPPSAYPPNRDVALLPISLWFAWMDPSDDVAMHSAIQNSSARLTEAALADGQDIAKAALYANYALFDTPLDRIFGHNLERLVSLREHIDPNDVMRLAGGWKI